MTIDEAIKKGIRRVYDPKWFEKNCYLKLPKLIEEKYGPWAELYSEETQKFLKIQTPQNFPLFMLSSGTNSYCEEYHGPISEFDKGD